MSYLKLLAFEGPLSGADFVQKAAKRPDVGLETVLDAHATLGTHIEGGSNTSRRHFQRIFEHLRNPKVPELGLELAVFLIPIDKNIFHLDIPVNDLFVVQVLHGQDDLGEDFADFLF